MTNTKAFFHDRLVLFLLTVNGFLTLVTVVSVLFRLGGDGRYIQSFRSNLGLGSVSVGGASELVAFVLFAAGLFVVHIFMALQFHKIRKVSSHVVLAMTFLLLTINLIVANALLSLR